MDLKSDQEDVRTAYLRGSVAQAIMGKFWLGSAALGTWVSVYSAVLLMVIAITLTFPLTQLTLDILGRPRGLPGSHPMNQLVFQIALMIPLSLCLIGPISLYNVNWFFPALMLVMGMHYILFIFLYGMWEFGVLAAVLLMGVITIGLIFPDALTPGGWFTGIVLLLFGLIVKRPLHFTE